MPTRQASGPRRRFGLSRSKAGCTVCRQRHLKCDEAKPSCRKCTAGGWTCVYQASPADGLTNGRRSRGSLTPGSSSDEDGSGLSIIRPDIDIGLTTTERRAIAYFTQYAANDMYGYLVSDLWTYVIPQRCMSVPVIRHAVVGLSTMHWDYVSTPHPLKSTDSVESSEQAIKAYDIAISSLRKYIADSDAPAKADVLLVCMILICCELLRGRSEEATKHLDKGVAIVKAWAIEINHAKLAVADAGTLQQQDDFERLSKAFVALEVHAIAFDDDRVPILRYLGLPGNLDTLDPTQLPSKFATVEDAQHALNQLLSTTFASLIESTPYKISLTSYVPQAILERRQTLRDMCDAWLVATMRLESDMAIWSTSTKAEMRKIQKTMAVLRAQHLSIHCLLHENLQVSLYDKEHCNSPFDEQAEHFLRWANIVTTSDYDATASAPKAVTDMDDERRKFSIDLGLGPPLILLAFKTTDPGVQNRAVTLLRKDRRFQGWYDLELMSSVIDELATHPEAPEPWSTNHVSRSTRVNGRGSSQQCIRS